MATWMQSIAYDPRAKRYYDIMRGGFVWTDELPDPDTDGEAFVEALTFLYRAIAYRASISLGAPDVELEVGWRKVEQELPNWPGFRKERRLGQVQRDLKAVKLREERCLRKLEHGIDE